MKVKCIDSNGGWLTIGKIYEVLEIDEKASGFYWMMNNYGKRDWYFKDRFKPLSEIRIEKINKLLRL
jgi:hypothetical protein